jgi:hypothetical protein
VKAPQMTNAFMYPVSRSLPPRHFPAQEPRKENESRKAETSYEHLLNAEYQPHDGYPHGCGHSQEKISEFHSVLPSPNGGLIAALTCGAAGGPKARRTSRQVKCLVPAQGNGTRPNEVSAAIPGDAVAGNKLFYSFRISP